MSSRKENCYPIMHFAPDYGWLNDPNGLVYHDGIFELYYQSNPNGVEWDDMTWGHARSTDLIHWEELEPVLYPDENGMMYSGCGLRNDRGELGLPKDALLFPYTAAGFDEGLSNPYFTIRLAYSTDGGASLIKRGDKLLQEMAPDNRDPKVFWHEDSKAYILVLWIEKNDFGIFRSPNMQDFELSQRITLEGGFECPDLFELPVIGDDGNVSEKRWVFWAADGMYFVGDFDGYKFTPTQDKKQAYFITTLPYAAQTWSGDPKGRVIQIPWLRTKCVYEQTTSAMGIPRELTLKKAGGDYVIRHGIPEEISTRVQPVSELTKGESSYISKDSAIFLELNDPRESIIKLYASGKNEPFVTMSYNSKTGVFSVSDGVVSDFMIIGRNRKDRVTIVYDRGIIELTTGDDIILQMTDLPHLRATECNRISFDGGEGSLKVGMVY
ncbi:glycoside hydrolase family 32 protein [Butyrivibrio sp. XPD2002]|uniref:glycoside hydrolase family 32 protein n=1 Tax=Butyrivibrio sp. XPD2002 TaxID=1280665 RepID=UPI00040EE1B9|nr:glycoside hydrolase family 32 protein [Butyrivibrio sp. XPD2002]